MMTNLSRFMMPYFKFLTSKHVSKVGLYQGLGFSAPVPMYRFYCEIHKEWVINYPQGHYQKLICPLCLNANS